MVILSSFIKLNWNKPITRKIKPKIQLLTKEYKVQKAVQKLSWLLIHISKNAI